MIAPRRLFPALLAIAPEFVIAAFLVMLIILDQWMSLIAFCVGFLVAEFIPAGWPWWKTVVVVVGIWAPFSVALLALR